MNAKILDVTLRDGGYCNGFHFHRATTLDIVESLHKSGIDYIEIGYRNGTNIQINNLGENGLCEDGFIEAIIKKNKDAKLAVMMHAKHCNVHDIDRLAELGVRMVRFCIGPELDARTQELLSYAKERLLLVCANLIRITERTTSDLTSVVSQLNKIGINFLYIADSNGSLTPSKTSEIFNFLKKEFDVPLGFHAHDNLGLALSNSIVALENGVELIDSSLTGIGKGSGNLATEKLVTYLIKRNGEYHYELTSILEVIERLKHKNDVTFNMLKPESMISGLFDLNMEDIKKIKTRSLRSYYQHALEIFSEKKQLLEKYN